MIIRTIAKTVLPSFIVEYLRTRFSLQSRARRKSNEWLLEVCKGIQGDVLSIGSGDNTGKNEDYYKRFFSQASSYTTSEISPQFGCDLTLDIRSMPCLTDESYDCIFCSGVLEHVDDYESGFKEITRILKTGGILLLGLPFRQPIHMEPNDFWRFTEHGIRFLLKDSYEIINMVSIDPACGYRFPAAYWFKAVKKAYR